MYQGTMEQKIYERSVTKQAVACRVVDSQQIDRHYNMDELTELYKSVKTNKYYSLQKIVTQDLKNNVKLFTHKRIVNVVNWPLRESAYCLLNQNNLMIK